jgi:hypothetical protein
MKHRILSVVAVIAIGSGIALGSARSDAPKAAAPKAPPALRSEFVFEARVTVDKPIVVGDGPHGLRRIVPISGGSIEGPKLKGTVVPGGADWQFVRPDGTLQIEAKYTLQSDDGVLIMITNRGVRRGPKEVIERLAKGEAVDPSQYYFRTSAEFEAPVGSKYAWLNNSVFVGVAERQANAAVIRFFEVK